MTDDFFIHIFKRYNLNYYQAKCVDMAADGKARKEIASALNIEVDGVSERLKRAALRMGVEAVNGQYGLAFARMKAQYNQSLKNKG